MVGRWSEARATLTSVPWRRAPVLLRRRPGLVAAVAGAVAVTVAALAIVPLFLSSVGTGAVEAQVAERCPRSTGVSQVASGDLDEVQRRSSDPFTPLSTVLGPTNHWMVRERLSLEAGDGRSLGVTLLTRDRALEHVEVVESAGAGAGPGLWLTDRAAELTGLGVGDDASVAGVPAPVVGVYRDLAGVSVDDFWCATGDLLLLSSDLEPPPPVVLADPATFTSVIEGADAGEVVGAWTAPLASGLTLDQVEGLIPRLACGAGHPTLAWCEDGQPVVGEVRGADWRVRQVRAVDDADFVERFLGSSLPFVAARTRAMQTSIASGIWPVAVVAALAGLGLVVAAASLWFDRRRRDLELLSVRGVSPAALGLKAVLELLLPATVGGAAGIGLARVAAGALGPSPVIEGRAVGVAAAIGAMALAASLAVIWLVVARRARGLELGSPRRRWAELVPWEVGLVTLTVVAHRRLGQWGVPVGQGAQVTRVDVIGLLFPVLFLLSGVALLARGVGLALGPLRRWSRRWPPAMFLALRRVARHRVAVTGLVAAAGVAAGVLGYASTIDRSLEATLDLKSSTFVGSDVAVELPSEVELPEPLAARSTTVVVHRQASVELGRRTSIHVLGVDPETLARAAVWDASFDGAPLQDLLDALDEPGPGPVPALVVGLDRDTPMEIVLAGARTRPLEVDPRPVQAFPGMSKPRPTVIVDATALDALDARGGVTETWIAGDHDEVLAALDTAGIPFEEQRRAADVADRAAFLTVSWTFSFMRSLALVAGALALGGAAAYLDARRRERTLSHLFLRRMGLTPGGHRRALGLELASSLLVGIWTGVGLALLAAALANPHLDPVPGLRPAPVLRPATTAIAGLVTAGAVVVVVAAILAQRRVDADDPVEVLRAAG